MVFLQVKGPLLIKVLSLGVELLIEMIDSHNLSKLIKIVMIDWRLGRWSYKVVTTLKVLTPQRLEDFTEVQGTL